MATAEARMQQLHPDDEAPHVVDLNATLETLREEPEYAENGRNGVLLVKNAELRVVLQAMRAGAELLEHQAPGPITVHVLEGSLRFQTGEEGVELHPGELLTLPAHRRHAVLALQDAVFLLTIAPEGRSPGESEGKPGE